MKTNSHTLFLIAGGLLLVGGVHAASATLTTGTESRTVAAPTSLNGAVIRMEDGTVISILSPTAAVVNDCDTEEFAYRVHGRSIYIKSVHLVKMESEHYSYRLTGDVTGFSPARIVITERNGNVCKGIIMGYFGHDCCGDLTSHDCLKGVPVTITLPC